MQERGAEGSGQGGGGAGGGDGEWVVGVSGAGLEGFYGGERCMYSRGLGLGGVSASFWLSMRGWVEGIEAGVAAVRACWRFGRTGLLQACLSVVVRRYLGWSH